MRRQVSPADWTSTLVSRPGMLVNAGCPERTSRQTGALFSGWVCCRCCSACGPDAGGCCGACASAAPPATSETAANKLQKKRMPILLLIADALVFVLPVVARLDLVLPAHAIALGPLPAAVPKRLVVPGTTVGLALILALLVDHDLLF